jgi:Zn-dependent M28 family amino/carboxypeptidase
MFDTDTADPDPRTRDLAGRAFADPFPWRFLTRIAEIPDRLGGSPGERRAADLVRGALPGDASVHEFHIERWERGHTDLAVAVERPDGTVERTFEAVALPYSPGGTVDAPLVDVGYGTGVEIDGADLDGVVAVARTDSPESERFVHRMEKYGHAVEAGAAAFVFTNHVPGQLPPTGSLRFGGKPSDVERGAGGAASVPGVGVSRETGAWRADNASGSADATARLDVEATTTPGESRNVVTHLGPDTDERVVLVAHLDAHDVAEGALDNGAGLTVAVTAARLLAALAGDPDAADPGLGRGVTVAAVGCEETGLLGAEALADRLDAAVGLDSVHAVCNVDGAGRARDLRAFTHGLDAVESLATEVTDGVGVPCHVERTPHPYSDHWPFLRAGVPALQLHSRSPPSTAGAGPGGGPRGRGYTHTRADTRDKVDRRDLRSHAVLTALLVRELCRRDLPRQDPAEVAAELRDAGAEPGMRAAGVWPENWD